MTANPDILSQLDRLDAALPALDPAVGFALRAALGLLFATAAYHKAADLRRFGASLEAYRIFPNLLARVVAPLVPIVETAVAVALLVPGLRVAAAVGATGLLIVYTAAIALNLARGRRDLDCGCGGPGVERPIGPHLLARNFVLIVAAAAAAAPPTARALIWLDAVAIVGTLVCTALLWAAADNLTAVATRRALRAEVGL